VRVSCEGADVPENGGRYEAMVKVRIFRISKQGRTLWATAEFSSEGKALEWATRRIAELMSKGYLASVRLG